MKRSNKKPEIYKKLHKQFKVKWENGIIITYGDTMYCDQRVSRIKYIHEKIHSKRQLSYGVDNWWKKYLEDKNFRLDEESRAYIQERKFVEKNIRDIQLRKQIIEGMARDLSSAIYGNIVSYYSALKIILEGK